MAMVSMEFGLDTFGDVTFDAHGNLKSHAQADLWPHYEAMMTRIGGERGWPPPSRVQFEREAGPHGALCVGAPETVAGQYLETAGPLAI